jgi:hypothetical protein
MRPLSNDTTPDETIWRYIGCSRGTALMPPPIQPCSHALKAKVSTAGAAAATAEHAQ